ncbi:MAG: phage integrase SAM-like domain-containing protein [Muribaculaceae bacterium]|nr:phage integrase SAM-like domain-containing protein [Muribaculaceae bacterium]
MATFKAVVRKKRVDGLYAVYIRVGHKRQMGYIKTDKVVSSKQIKAGEIKDPFVNEYCSREILRYNNLMNQKNVSQYSIQELIDYLTTEQSEVYFSEYAQKHIKNLINTGHERTAKNYKMAVQHLERYCGTTRILFSQLTSTVLKRWIETMSQTNRAKEMYPVCVRQIFKSALLELNDEERNICRIKFNPWLKIQIPKADKGIHKAISAEACREFFNRPLPHTKMISSLPELGRDVALLVLCLGGMNTADIYQLKKTDYKDGIISYKRAKTRNSRSDEAYMEMRVEPFIKPIFEKYLDTTNDEHLFNFYQRYSNWDSFCANANNGIKKICKDMKMSEDKYYCCYTFRHTWATIAQNDCGATLTDVAFGLNHSHGFNVTRGYVDIDFTPAWELNAKIIEFIFFSNTKSKKGKAKDLEETKDTQFRITPKMMIYGRTYFKGNLIAEVTDIGFRTVEDVIKRMIPQLPETIPDGCTVHFRLKNVDSQKEVIYERTKGKGF